MNMNAKQNVKDGWVADTSAKTCAINPVGLAWYDQSINQIKKVCYLHTWLKPNMLLTI